MPCTDPQPRHVPSMFLNLEIFSSSTFLQKHLRHNSPNSRALADRSWRFFCAHFKMADCHGSVIIRKVIIGLLMVVNGYLWLVRVKVGVRVTFVRTLDRHTIKCLLLATE